MSADLRSHIDAVWPAQTSAAEIRVKRVAALFLLTARNGQACSSVIAGAVSRSIGSVSKLGLRKTFKQILVEDHHFIVTNTHPNEADISLNSAAFSPAHVQTARKNEDSHAALITLLWPPSVSPEQCVKHTAATYLSTCPNFTSNFTVLASKVTNMLGGSGVKQLGVPVSFKQLLLTEPDVFLFTKGPKGRDVTYLIEAAQRRAAAASQSATGRQQLATTPAGNATSASAAVGQADCLQSPPPPQQQQQQQQQQQPQSLNPSHEALINAVWPDASAPEVLVKRAAARFLSCCLGCTSSISKVAQSVDSILGGRSFKRLGITQPFKQLLLADADVFRFNGEREPTVTLDIAGLQHRATLMPQQQQQQQQQPTLPSSLQSHQPMKQQQRPSPPPPLSSPPPPPPPLSSSAAASHPDQQQQQPSWQHQEGQPVAVLSLPESLQALATLTVAECAAADVLMVSEPMYLPTEDILLFNDDDRFENMLQHVAAAKVVALNLHFAEVEVAAQQQQQQNMAGISQRITGSSSSSSSNSSDVVGRGRTASRNCTNQLALLQLFAPSATAPVTRASSSRHCRQIWSPTIYMVEVPSEHGAAAHLMALLTPFLQDAAVVKVMHDARQDSCVLAQFGVRPAGVLDTQVLAGLTGLAAGTAPLAAAAADHDGASSSDNSGWDGHMGRLDLAQLYVAFGYAHPRGGSTADMCKETGHLEDPRSWFKRPLPPELMQRAAHNVRYLLPTAHALLQQLPAAAMRVCSLQVLLALHGSAAVQLQQKLLPGYRPLMFPDGQAGSSSSSHRYDTSTAADPDVLPLAGLTKLQFEMKVRFTAVNSGWFTTQYVVYLNEDHSEPGPAAAAAVAAAAAAGMSHLVGVTGGQALLSPMGLEPQPQQQQQQQQKPAAGVQGGCSGSPTDELLPAAVTAESPSTAAAAAASYADPSDVDDAVASIAQLLPDRLQHDLSPYLLRHTQPQLVEIIADKNKHVILRLADRTAVELGYCIDIQQALARLRMARMLWVSTGQQQESWQQQQQQDGQQDTAATSQPADFSSESALGITNPSDSASVTSSSFASLLSDQDLPRSSGQDTAVPGTCIKHDKSTGVLPSRSLQGGSRMFGSDNRMGIPGTLHRISAMLDRQDSIYGLTYRVGRHVPGVAMLLADVLSSMKMSLDPDMGVDRPQSLLLLGRPGVGKTTLLRDIARLMSLPPAEGGLGLSVIIVDTSNEIAGDAEECHPCIGRARRMMVKHRSLQAEVLVQAVQNHNPDVIIVDEIGTPAEVSAARTISQRGVALVGTAHGLTLEGLLKNPELKPLVGGVKEVTLGDAEAKASNRGMKTRLERAGAATFVTLLELQAKNKWRLHLDVEQSVDILLGSSSSSSGGGGGGDRAWQQQQQGRSQVNTQTRSRDSTGRMLVQFDSPAAARQALAAAAAVASAAGDGPCEAGGRSCRKTDHLAGRIARQHGRGFTGGWLVDLLHAAVHQYIETLTD